MMPLLLPQRLSLQARKTIASQVVLFRRLQSSDVAKGAPILNLTVFGAGHMGAGIVQVAAYKGFSVTLCDSSEKALDHGRSIIQQSIARIAKADHPENKESQNKLVESVFDNIYTTTDPVHAAHGAELIIEAILEDVKIKQDLFKLLDRHAPPECVFATNTNGLSVTEIASSSSNERKTRFGGLHFFNPVSQMQLVEIIKTHELSSEAFVILQTVCDQLGKTAVSCKDGPGFIVNRLLIPYMAEAIRMLERGDANATDIDTAMKLGAGYPIGPIELADYIGLDTLDLILETWRRQVEEGSTTSVPASLVQPSSLLKQKISERKLGVKAGEGFFKHN